MTRTLLWRVVWFLLGGAITAAPFLISGAMRLADERARGELTMGPGMITGLGFVFAPIGGLLTVLIVVLIERRKQRQRGVSQGVEPDR